MMGKGHGRRKKQPCVEEAENDSVYVDSTIAVKKSVCWVVRFRIPVSPEKSQHCDCLSSCSLYKGRQYGCQLTRVPSFPIS